MAKGETRGQKTIVKENQETIFFYSAMAVISMFGYFTLKLLWIPFSFWDQLFATVAAILFAMSIFLMRYGAKPVYNDKGVLIDGGVDLNMKDGYVEHLKDLVIWTTVCQTASLLWDWLWLGLIMVPVYTSHLLWVNLIAPYIFQPAPEVDQEQLDKKNRKRDRQMRRMQ